MSSVGACKYYEALSNDEWWAAKKVIQAIDPNVYFGDTTLIVDGERVLSYQVTYETRSTIAHAIKLPGEPAIIQRGGKRFDDISTVKMDRCGKALVKACEVLNTMRKLEVSHDQS